MKKMNTSSFAACIVWMLALLVPLLVVAAQPDTPASSGLLKVGVVPASPATPVAVMPETAFEFPPTVEGEKITHKFVIQNRGMADLSILEIKTS